MSSELAAEQVGPGSDGRFRATVVVVLAVLLALAVGLGAVSATRGPSLESAEVDVTAAVSRPGQSVVIATDHVLQPLGPDDVTITPRSPFRVDVEGRQITIALDRALHYETDYAVRIRARSAGTGASATLAFDFTTPQAQVYALERAEPNAPSGAEDVVRRRLISAEDSEVVYRAPRIQEYAVADPAIAVVTSEPSGVGSLTVDSLDGSRPPRTVIRNAAITQLRSSGVGGIFGFIATERVGRYDRGPNRLFIVDPSSTVEPRPVTGLDGKPLIVNNWRFVPGTRSVVAQSEDSSIYLIDPPGTKAVTPLGAHSVMHGFAPGSTTLVVDDEERYAAIDLATGRTAGLTVGAVAKDSHVYDVVPLTERDQIRVVGKLSEEVPRFAVEQAGGGRSVQIFEADDPATWLERACVSPNAQYVAIESSPDGAAVDDYSELPAFSPVTTTLLEVASRRVVATIPGFLVDWCG